MGVLSVVVVIGVFYAGMMYARSGTRGQFNGQFPGAQMGMRNVNGRVGMNAGGIVFGEIISKNETGVTVKMQDGSTKITLIDSNAQIMKSSAGSLTDLLVGTTISVTGTTNSDGSVTAQTVQIRPATSTFPGPRTN